jgi:hypothetical protein
MYVIACVCCFCVQAVASTAPALTPHPRTAAQHAGELAGPAADPSHLPVPLVLPARVMYNTVMPGMHPGWHRGPAASMPTPHTDCKYTRVFLCACVTHMPLSHTNGVPVHVNVCVGMCVCVCDGSIAGMRQIVPLAPLVVDPLHARQLNTKALLLSVGE